MTPVVFARAIALCGGAGLIRPAPGTWGSLVGLAIGILSIPFGHAITALLAAGAFSIGYWAAGIYASATQRTDPSEVVIDEAAAMLLVMAFIPATPLIWAIGFALFRLFDIAKPWPVSWADRSLDGALGIMADDFIAALLSIGCVWLIQYLLGL